MQIYGLSKLTLLDYPGHIACTVFTGSCNFRCPFCHNGGLVLNPSETPLLSDQSFFDFLSTRKEKLEGVCISGGEPTLQPDLKAFIKKIKAMGFLVKLDTNGYRPEKLKELLDNNLLDMISMDIKNCLEKYAGTAGFFDDSIFNTQRISQSVSYIAESGIPHEFRTTIVRELHTAEDIETIAKWLPESSPYFLQTYTESDQLLYRIMNTEYSFSVEGNELREDGANKRNMVLISMLNTLSAYTEEETREILNKARKYHQNTKIRGTEA